MDLISFTDHNQVNAEAYSIFRRECDYIEIISDIEKDIKKQNEWFKRGDIYRFIGNSNDASFLAEKLIG